LGDQAGFFAYNFDYTLYCIIAEVNTWLCSGEVVMSRKRYELTWHKPRNCWSKFYLGRRYYCPHKCRGKTDAAGYAQSLEWWRVKKKDVDFLAYEFPTEISEAEIQKVLAQLNGESATDIPPYSPMLQFRAHLGQTQLSVQPTDYANSIEDLIDEFLVMSQQRVKLGAIQVASYEDIYTKLGTFREFLSDVSYVYEISDAEKMERCSQILSRYRDLVGAEVKSRKISPTTARKRLGTVKRLFAWAYRHDRILTLPRVIDSEYPKVVALGMPSPEFFELPSIYRLFDASTQRTKLYIALALNCGWLPSDIATLSHGMIDWETGILSRDRHKNGIKSSFRLWPVTTELLRSEMTKGRSGLMLLGAKGNPLITHEISANGKPKPRVTAIRLAFDRVRRKTGLMNGPSFKAFRSTSGQHVRKKYPTAVEVADAYLAHAEVRPTRNHYTTRQFEVVHDACDHLDTIYKLGERLPS
jgi:integrase